MMTHACGTLFVKEWRDTARSAFLLALIPAASAALVVLAARMLASPDGYGMGNIKFAYQLVLLPMWLAAPFFLLAGRFASERSEGTLDFLAALPVGRSRVFISKAAVAFLQFLPLGLLAIALLSSQAWGFLIDRPVRNPWDDEFSTMTMELFVAAGVFLLASVLCATPSLAALAGGALYVGTLVARVWISEPEYPFPAALLVFFLSLGAAYIFWIKNVVLRIGWKAVVIVMFIFPSAMTAEEWLQDIIDRDLMLVTADGVSADIRAENIAADDDGFWTSRRHTLTRWEWSEGRPREKNTIMAECELAGIAMWDSRVMGLSQRRDTRGRLAGTMLQIFDGEDSISFTLTDDRWPYWRKASSGNVFAFLLGGDLFTVAKSGDTYVMTRRPESAVDLGFDRDGNLILMRCKFENDTPRYDGYHMPVHSPEFWMVRRTETEPRPAPENLTATLTANVVTNGRITTIWERLGRPKSPEPVYSAGRTEAVLTEQNVVRHGGARYSPNAIMHSNRATDLDWHQPPADHPPEALVVTSLHPVLQNPHRTLSNFPPLDGHNPWEPRFRDIVKSGERILVLDDYCVIWVDLKKVDAATMTSLQDL